MSAPPIDPRPWPAGRWLAVIALVFAAQIGLIFAVGDHKPVEPRQPAMVPQLHLAAASGELSALSDPTVFALPSKHGFSAAAWLEAPEVTAPAFVWSEPERWLPLPVGQLGSVLTALMETNRLHIGYEITRQPGPEIILPHVLPPPSPKTVLSVEGDLAQRPIVLRPKLPLVSYPDVLQDSVVQVFVDELGNVVTTALIPPGSGLDAADQKALQLAKGVQFAPVEDGQTHWTRGSLIFQWGTMQTNAPATPAQ